MGSICIASASVLRQITMTIPTADHNYRAKTMKIETITIIEFVLPQDAEKEKEFIRKNVNPLREVGEHGWTISYNGKHNGKIIRDYIRDEVFDC